jgi:hypothetical protein
MRVTNRSVLGRFTQATLTSETLTLADLCRDPAVYLLPMRDLEEQLERDLTRFCKAIFE